jgi:hypothetical protein
MQRMADIPNGNPHSDLTRPTSSEGLESISKLGEVPHGPRWSTAPLLFVLLIVLVAGGRNSIFASSGSRPISDDKNAVDVPAATRQNDRNDVPMLGGNPGRTDEVPDR